MRHTSIILSTTLLLTIWPLAATAQSQGESPHRHDAPSAEDDGASKAVEGHQMMGRHQEMRERMQAMDTELDRLLEKVRAASGEARVAALTEVVEKLVEQRKAMHQMMMRHHQSMTMMHHEMMREKRHGMEDRPMKKMHGAPDAASAAEEGDDPEHGDSEQHPE